MQITEPYCANVREPVVPAEDKIRVSVVIAIVTAAAAILINEMAVPMG